MSTTIKPREQLKEWLTSPDSQLSHWRQSAGPVFKFTSWPTESEGRERVNCSAQQLDSSALEHESLFWVNSIWLFGRFAFLPVGPDWFWRIFQRRTTTASWTEHGSLFWVDDDENNNNCEPSVQSQDSHFLNHSLRTFHDTFNVTWKSEYFRSFYFLWELLGEMDVEGLYKVPGRKTRRTF